MVDDLDVIKKRRKDGKLDIKYRAYCYICHKDRGYHSKNRANRRCRGCSAKSSHLTISNTTRVKMSLAKIGKSPWNKGTKGISALTRQKMSQSKLGHVATNKNKPMNLEQKIKLSCANQGIKEAEFSGFTTSLSKIEREKLYKLNLHRECFERDNFMCQACNRQGGELNAHHVESWKFHPDLRYDINNLITLCKRCHKDFHSKFGSGSKTALKKKHLLLFKANKPQNKI